MALNALKPPPDWCDRVFWLRTLAKLQPLLGDAQSKPEVGAAEVEKMNEQGASAIVGSYASAICLATTQAAAKYNIPHVVDVGVADQIVSRVALGFVRPGSMKSAMNDGGTTIWFSSDMRGLCPHAP